MDGEGTSAPADFLVRDSVNISLGEMGVESGAGEQEFQEGCFIYWSTNLVSFHLYFS